MKKIIASMLLAAAPACSFGNIITYDFTVTGGPEGPLAGTTSSGYFRYDDAVAPPGGGTVSLTGLLTDLSFDWLGTHWNETTANTGWINFAASGSTLFWNFGTACDPGVCRVGPERAGWFIGASGITSGGHFLYSVGDGERTYGDGTFTSSLRLPIDVPEPSTLALLGVSVLSVVLVWSRRLAPRHKQEIEGGTSYKRGDCVLRKSRRAGRFS